MNLLPFFAGAVVAVVWAGPRHGVASYYHHSLDGRPTASGEAYSSQALTAAHKKLPLGTRIRVTHAISRKSVIVRVNDRGPYAAGRVLDLSLAAFRKIEDPQKGLAPVRFEVLH